MRLLLNKLNWEQEYLKEVQEIKKILANRFKVSFYHVGGTSIPGSYTQPIIDIVIGVKTEFDYFTIKDILFTNGYLYNSKRSTLRHLLLGKANSKGEIKFLIHVCPINSMSFQNLILSNKLLRNSSTKLKNLNTIKNKYKNDTKLYDLYKKRYFEYICKTI